jgi:hypothetical protein
MAGEALPSASGPSLPAAGRARRPAACAMAPTVRFARGDQELAHPSAARGLDKVIKL